MTSKSTPGPPEQPARLLAAYTTALEVPNFSTVLEGSSEVPPMTPVQTPLAIPVAQSIPSPVLPTAPPVAGFNALLAHLYRQAA